jgi:hypothetical protein
VGFFLMTAVLRRVVFSRTQTDPPGATLVQMVNLISRAQLPHDQTVSGDVDRIDSFESPQLRESICCVVAARVEPRNDLALFPDPMNAGSDVPKDQS